MNIDAGSGSKLDHPGRVAVVVGGGGEIGGGIATELIKMGAKIHCLDLAVGNAVQLAPAFHAVDVTDEAQVEKVFNDIARDEGRIDYMFYCAGVFHPRAVIDMSPEEFIRTIRINLSGAFLCCRATIRAMRERRFGRIVLISSLIARAGMANGVHYGASKGGLLGLVKGFGAEVEEWGIRINAISPGVVDTAMPRAHSTEDRLMEVARSIPLQRIARVEDVVDACLFLIEESSGSFGSQNIFLTGGIL